MRLHPADTVFDPSFPEEAAPQQARMRESALRRRVLWAGSIALLIALAILVPPLINVNRYRNQIAQTMSASLGRPVHLDNVSLHLMPTPGFTLQNLVVSEDAEFGAEPTVRADSVEATLRISSLWHRPVEFSTVRFVNPSVNLVRNAEGRWNLSEVLLHASRVNSAPTDQRRAGPTPRFPYIEATGGRVNVKLGEEKLPFSLTDADFALWLPSPQQWRLRLVGHPARTDTNITDPGTMRVEGELRRADTAAAVPVSFRASWHDAPLGEASRLLTGDDWGWRGSLNVDAALDGTLGNAQLAGKLTLGGLRRAEFFPAHPLDLQVSCGAGFMVHPGALNNVRCTLPDDGPEPLTFTADRVSLQTGEPVGASVQAKQIPMHWALLWAALFSSRIPTDLHPAGLVDVDVVRGAPVQTPVAPSRRRRPLRSAAVLPPAPSANSWTGTIQMTLPASADTGADATHPNAAANILAWKVQPAAAGTLPQLHLDPTPVRLGPNATVTVSGNVGAGGSFLSVSGSAPAAALLVPARYLPQLGDGLEQVLPYPPTGIDPVRVEFSCAHPWNGPQTCTGLQPAQTGAKIPPVPAPRTAPRIPNALAPRSLSPFDYASPSTPR